MFRKMLRSMSNTRRKSVSASAEDILCSCGSLQIHLPPGHTLPRYQHRHPEYDRFLPHFASFISSDATIIEVGANCGYMAAAMAQQNHRAEYICIEPDLLFNSYLRSNLDILRSVYPEVQVSVLDDLVGKNVRNALLKNSGGTSVAVPGEGLINARTLDDIMTGFPGSRVHLLKSDVDGFDYDVIRSAERLIEGQKPAIYFECQHEHNYQRRGFEEVIQWLSRIGYTRWSLFDNFGAFLMTAEDTGLIFSLMNYIMRQNEGRSTRTMYYLDILCVCDEYKDAMNAAIESY